MSNYGTLASADAYWLAKMDYDQLWAGQPDSEKTKALVTATQLIDALNFQGSKTVSTQELEFPRGTDTIVPTKIEEACYEIAYAILDGRDPEKDLEHINAQTVGYGTARLRVNAAKAPESKVHGIPSELAWKWLKPFLRDKGSLTFVRVS